MTPLFILSPLIVVMPQTFQFKSIIFFVDCYWYMW